ncbi:hypothetical protein ISN45_Aa01g011170 [Arabidopsis thaliana x Arabidopsis arenosa]|uniref:Uncharacterized protein n=2 Tax=Arabidopsis TaxID=3701 RepID=A0A8T2CRF4_ARASU|nr:hypothetical protein ISN45_Aa01g011170 [Arabidopsis thaliana x Arabidopsis arenosa]KAG7597531.1 hypothetical protein ISN44_As06g018820 [Arabidopsis suecica]
MGVSIRNRRMVLLLLIAFSVLQTDKVSGLRWDRNMRLQLLFVHPLRVLEESELEPSSLSKEGNIDTNGDLAPSPFVMSDPNQSVKRMIGRGSDPIHNKYNKC